MRWAVLDENKKWVFSILNEPYYSVAKVAENIGVENAFCTTLSVPEEFPGACRFEIERAIDEMKLWERADRDIYGQIET